MRVVEGRVDSVAFCDCCDPVTVEVRTYEHTVPSAPLQVPPEPFWPIELGDGRFADEYGVFRRACYEPDEY